MDTLRYCFLWLFSLNHIQKRPERVWNSVCVLSCVQLFTTPWTVADQAPPSMGFSRQEYWTGLSCPPPGDLPNQGIKPTSLMSLALADGFFTISPTWESPTQPYYLSICVSWRRREFIREFIRDPASIFSSPLLYSLAYVTVFVTYKFHKTPSSWGQCPF